MKAWISTHASFLLLIVAAGLAYGLTLDSHGMFIWDEAEYASIARGLSDGEGFSIEGEPNSLRPPVLPLTGAIAMAIGGSDSDVTLKWGVWFWSMLAICAVYFFGTLTWDREVGLWSAAALTLAPAFWQHSTFFLSETPYSLFFFTAVMCLLLGFYRNPRYFLGTWVSWGLAVLTRYTAVLFGPVTVVIMIGMWFTDRDTLVRAFRSRWFWLAPLAAVVVAAPWLVRQQLVFGDALVGFKIASGQLQRYLPEISMPWHYYVSRIPESITFPAAALALVGLIQSARKRVTAAGACLLVILFLFGWFSAYRYKEVRLITSVLPFLAIMTGLGMNQLWTGFQDRPKAAWIPGVIAAALLAISFPGRDNSIKSSVALGYPVFKDAMQWVRSTTPENTRIMSASGPQTWWYSERIRIDIPGDPNKLLGHVQKVDLVVINNFERSQPQYITRLITLFNARDVENGQFHFFSGNRLATAVIDAELFYARVERDSTFQAMLVDGPRSTEHRP